ncbi:MAG: TerC family protein [Gammaproteobacteria bacterium]|nr:TerC family protein [Gammaproteobacteria bacterium]
MLDWLADSHTWIGLLEIIGINIVLSGDNAVVIALACRDLPPRQQQRAIFLGSLGAILLRVVLTGFAAALLNQAYIKLIGALLLLWIAVKLLLPEGQDDGKEHDNADLWAAIKTIVIADLVMSLDNVIGVAAAAKGDLALLILGLVISMPMIIYGSTVILKLMGRFPLVITFGGALLGYVAGEMAVSEAMVAQWISATAQVLENVLPAVCAISVVLAAKMLTPQPVPVDESVAESRGEQ